ncbi:MBOAT, membrane-bound O-acyltransferase family-domain-containing protein [Phlyctochytrium arcticum]|nr:MBOAT, membrane-bound O-acyltransferase family-domain-containing protein [Phlyctochytrium arcticum]
MLESLQIPGLAPDLIKAAVMLASSFPAALLFRLIPAKHQTLKHLFSIAVSGTLFVALFDKFGFAQLVGNALVVYAITASMRDTKKGPVLAFLVSMGQLSINHVVSQLIYQTNVSFDHSAPMMVLVIKLTSFAWAAHDGTKPLKELSDDQRQLAIREMPGIIEFFGYVFYFPAFLVGPSFEFRDYQKFIRREAPYDNVPSCFVPTVRAVGAALICFFLFFKFGSQWSYMYCLTDEYQQSSFLYRLFYLQIAGGLARTKYYIAWKLSEGACDLTGIGYNGRDPKTGEERWDRIQNIPIRKFELAENPKKALEYWNKNTGLWLRRYVYLRITPPGTKPTAATAIATYTTSAFWHGFRPGFYLTFITGSFLNIGARTLRRNVRPLFIAPSKLAPFKPVYDILGWAGTIGAINYLVAPFIVHSVHNSLTVWKSNFFLLHVFLLVTEVGYSTPLLRSLTKKLAAAVGAPSTTTRPASKAAGKVTPSESVTPLVKDAMDGGAIAGFKLESPASPASPKIE